ncbi:twin-arginine translocase subunit TatC [Deferribacter autotrophicus]|uniref:Sec-independent protein translocase protein TatC n=1 Tax=Deferribacter autotrophicus TaxID=500465 RepID=A0A5A8F3Q7_9BACT|nr:twin-arginine translocase subunit TatC [Deferribacter autotrophicus]KAA0257663.1 twin-arginine translocase subunit TatC [Deferribacter autotrophicus]
MANVDEKLPLTAHLEELRSRLIKSLIVVLVVFIVCYSQSKYIFDFVTAPLVKVLPEKSSLAMIKLTEGFFTELKLSLMAAVFFSMPFILYQLWKFVAPGLYAHERRYIVSFVIVSSFLFFTGAVFAYYVVFPFGFQFFLSYAKGYVIANLSIQWYLSFVVRLIMGFGIIFELPVFTLFLAKMGIVTASMMRKYRRYAIVMIFIAAAILTPPDVFTQLMMAGPLILLYEISIFVAKIFGRKDEIKKEDIYE